MQDDRVIDLAIAGGDGGRAALASVAPAPAEGVARSMFACLAEPRVLDVLDVVQDGLGRFIAICDALAASSHQARTEIACALARLRRRGLIVRNADGYVLTALGRLIAPSAAQMRRFSECYESCAAATPSQELWLVRRVASQLRQAGACPGARLDLVVERDAETVAYRLCFEVDRVVVRVLCDPYPITAASAARGAVPCVYETIESLGARVRRGDALTGAWRPVRLRADRGAAPPVRSRPQAVSAHPPSAYPLDPESDLLVIDDAAS